MGKTTINKSEIEKYLNPISGNDKKSTLVLTQLCAAG